MKESIKQRQVAALIQREFSVVLQNEGVYIYGETLVTVTRVRMSSDLGSVYNSLYKQEVIKEIWERVSRLRGELGKRIRKQVRRIPVIKFFIDDTLDEMDHLNRLFINLDTEEGKTRSMKEALDAQADRDKEALEDDED